MLNKSVNRTNSIGGNINNSSNSVNRQIFLNQKFHFLERFATDNPTKCSQLTNKIIAAGGKRDLNESECIVVLDEFFNEEYNQRRKQGVPMIGIPYLEECLSKGTPIDIGKVANTPLYTNCLEGQVICINDQKDHRNELKQRVEAMNGTCTFSLDNTVTHLLTSNLYSKKSVAARQSSIYIQFATVEWLRECWREKTMVNPMPFNKPVFRGCTICPTGFSQEEKRGIEKSIVENGGQYTATLDKSCSHLLAKEQSGMKFDKAREWSLFIVPKAWLDESITNGIQNERDYVVDVISKSLTSPASQGSLINPINSYIPTPLPSTAERAAAVLTPSFNQQTPQHHLQQQKQQYQSTPPPVGDEDIEMGGEEPNLFRSKHFTVVGFEDATERRFIIDTVSRYATFIDDQSLPVNLLADPSLRIHFVFVPHATKVEKSLLPVSAQVVSVDWFDACLRENKILDPSSCVYYRPFIRLGVFKGLRIVATGFSDKETDNLRMTSKLLKARFTMLVKGATTHLVVATPVDPNNQELAKALQLNAERPNRLIHLVTAQWVYESAKSGEIINESYFAVNLLKGKRIFISSKYITEDRLKYSSWIKELGGETADTFFESITHYMGDESNYLETQKFIDSTFVKVTSKWLEKCWVGNKLCSEDDFQPIDATEHTNRDDPVVLQVIARTPSQLFSGTPAIKTEPNEPQHSDVKVEKAQTANDDNVVKKEKENEEVAKVKEEDTSDLMLEDSSGDEKEGAAQKPSSKLDLLFKALDNLPEQTNHKNNGYALPVAGTAKRKPIQAITSIIPKSKPGLDLLQFQSQEDADDDEDNSGDEEDILSQRVTYGEGSEQIKRMKLMQSKPFFSHKNSTTSSYLSKKDSDQQMLLDILKKGHPVNAKPELPQFYLLSGFEDSNRPSEDLMNSFSRITGIQRQPEPEFVPGKTTHIIVQQPKKSEKYLCGCAAGCWLVSRDYVDAVQRQGTPLDEAPFEWSQQPSEESAIANSSKLCREAVQRLGRPLFSKVVIVVEKKMNIWYNILKCGGATAYYDTDPKVTGVTHKLCTKVPDRMAPELKYVTTNDLLHQYIKFGKHLVPQ
ncbi:hypothetical protein SAMD00019534_007300 [Acytostelium subglobosum LB1]|uniref:hypothetical protein n=1 Tax=Acytostelium subglobosum LB1 TaxID=1410327 RepID=UPI000644B326|nr:hypothetical protein SAMD00019534_007300 [Acytostelium subglobosum LB1]GAM17555.1 hypothetical protein SAMD00019534_007300 [Acytostelium subglobosum LB1]|eukprot:XP_012759617.1 hypothetical protein SAMD00019534_007300 [Acytostelium subglobosum LB1]